MISFSCLEFLNFLNFPRGLLTILWERFLEIFLSSFKIYIKYPWRNGAERFKKQILSLIIFKITQTWWIKRLSFLILIWLKNQNLRVGNLKGWNPKIWILKTVAFYLQTPRQNKSQFICNQFKRYQTKDSRKRLVNTATLAILNLNIQLKMLVQ